MRLAVTLAGILLASPATAQVPFRPVCKPYDVLSSTLAKEFGESVQYRGLTSAGNMVELWTNAKAGSFSLLERDAYGQACVEKVGLGSDTVAIPGFPS